MTKSFASAIFFFYFVKKSTFKYIKMDKKINQNLKLSRSLSFIMIILGVALAIFMIIVEGELGAIPLLFLVIGIAWFIISQYRIKRQR